MNFLQYQKISMLTQAVVIAVVAVLFIRSIASIVLVVLLSTFVVGLYKEQRWVYYYGYVIIIITLISVLAWQILFKDEILQNLKHIDHTILSGFAIVNMFVAAALIISLTLNLFVQRKLKEELRE